MNKIEEALQAEGYWVWNEGYPSRSQAVEELASATLSRALAACRAESNGKIHFVTHSLGGILVRQYFQNLPADDPVVAEVGRIVMLSPPNGGSEVVDRLKGKFLFRWILGPAGRQLGTDAASVPNSLASMAVGDIGIITGNRSSDPWFSPLIAGADDGKVSVESAKLDGMKDFLVLAYGHTTIMKQHEVVAQIQYFLKHACFQRPQQDGGNKS